MSVPNLGTKILCFDCGVWFWKTDNAKNINVMVDPGVCWSGYVCENCHEPERNWRHESEEDEKGNKLNILPPENNII